MPAIANYYAQVGIQVDPSGAAKVTRYLDGIKKQMLSFQKELGKTAEVSLRVKIDTTRSLASINREMKILSGAASLTIRNVNFSKSEIIKGLNRTISGSHGRTNLRVGALLSQESLSGMRAQLRASINSLVVSPTIRPNVVPRTRRGSGGGIDDGGGGRRSMGGLSPFSKRGMNPWYNPMLPGGAIGAFARYGVYSLPFVAGAMGLNALSNNVQGIQNARLAITSQIGNRAVSEKELKFLEDIGRVHGTTIQSMAPSYGQIYASAQGTEMEKYLHPIFKGFIQYASVKGLGSEQKAGAMLAMSQMIGLRGKGIGQEIRQMINQGIPEFRKLMADAVAGGDEEKLAGMLQGGTFGMQGLIKTFMLMRDRAQPFLPEYYGTVERNRGTVKQANEAFLTSFYQGGGAAGLADFYRTLTQVTRDAIGSAGEIGAAFEKVSRVVQALILAPGEITDWFSGVDNSKNFMQMLFGKPTESEFLATVKATFSSLTNIVAESMDRISKSVSPTKDEIYGLLNFLTDSLKGLNLLLNLASGYNEAGFSGLMYAHKQNVATTQAEQMAQAEADKVKREHGIDLPMSAILQRRKDIYESMMSGVDKPQSTLDTIRELGAKNSFDLMGVINQGVFGSDAAKKYLPNSLEKDTIKVLPQNTSSGIVEYPKLPPDAPYIWNTPQTPNMQGNSPVLLNVVISGEIGVKPDEAFSPTLQAAVGSEANRAIENALRGFFPATGGGVIGGRPQ